MDNAWKVVNQDTGNEKKFDNRSDAEEKLQELQGLFDKSDLELKTPTDNIEDNVQNKRKQTSDGGSMEPKIIENENSPPDQTKHITTSTPTIDHDPLDVLPGWMVSKISFNDRGDSTRSINKRGTEVIASHLELEVQVDDITPAEETDFKYAYYRAKVTKPDGRTFNDVGAARADGDDQDESEGWKLDMMAATRAKKRAVKSATGGGLEAFTNRE